MSYHTYRNGDYSDSEASDSSYVQPPTQAAKSKQRRYDPISDSGSEESADTLSNFTNGNQNRPQLNGHSSSSSQGISQIQRVAAKCNVQKLKHVLSSYGIKNLSSKRKPQLVERIGTCYADLDEDGQKLLEELLADPSGNSSRASSSNQPVYEASTSNGHRYRASTPEVNWKIKKHGKTAAVMDSDEDDEDYMPQHYSLHPHNGHHDDEVDNGEGDYEQSPIQPSKGRRRHQALSSDESESVSSPEVSPPRRGPKKHQSSRFRNSCIPSRDKPSSSSAATTSPSSSRSRILLTLPKTFSKPSSSSTSHQQPPPSTHNTAPGQVTHTYPNGTSTTLINGGPTDPRQARSTIRPYVPRNPASSSSSNAVVNPAAGWPPPLPVEPSNGGRKRSINEYLNDRITGEIDALAAAASGSPTKRTFSAAGGMGNNFPPVTMPSGYSLHNFVQYPSFPNNNNNNQGSPSSSSSSFSTGRKLLTNNGGGSSSAVPYRYPGTPEPFPTSQGFSSAQMNNYINSLARSGEQLQQGSNHIATISLNRNAVPVSNTGFTAASVLLASRDNGRTWHPPGQVNGTSHGPYRTPLSSTSRLPTHSQLMQPTTANRTAPSSAGGTPSIMSNNPFAQAFANSAASTESGADGSSANKVVKFSVNQTPAVKAEEANRQQDMFQRVIKPAVFHQLLFEVGLPMSIRKDQTMSSRGVYREILTTFFFDKSTVNSNDPDTLLLIRFCLENPTMANYESHPDNLKLMLNGKTLVEPAVVDFSNRMKKKKNAVFNQPVEVPLELLAAQNVILVRWTEDTAGTTPGLPATHVPDEPPKEFYMVIECVRRKTMEEILQTVSANTIPLDETVHKIYETLGVGDGDIVADSQKVSLLCPASRSRLNLPIRGRHCDHIECFDASSFLYMNKAPKARWTCPKCNKPVHFDEIVVDEFIGSLLHEFQSSDCIEATYENSKVVIREAKKAPKSEAKPVSSASKSASSSSSAQASTSSAPLSSTASKAPPEIITLD